MTKDPKDLLEALRTVFEIEGHRASVNPTGENVIEQIQSLKPDVVVLDVFLSEKDGRLICERIKRHQHLRKTPVILISALLAVRDSAIKAGADEFISKPFEINHLLNTVRDIKKHPEHVN